MSDEAAKQLADAINNLAGAISAFTKAGQAGMFSAEGLKVHHTGIPSSISLSPHYGPGYYGGATGGYQP